MENPTKKIETVLDNVLMPVSMEKTSDLLFNPLLEIPSKMQNAVIREGKIYGFVSDNFALVQPSEVHSILSEKLGQFGLTKFSGKMDANGNFNLRYTMPDQYERGSKEFLEALKNKDLINPAYELRGGIAGTRTLGGNGFGSRPVCENGMSIAETIFSFASKNTKRNHASKVGANNGDEFKLNLELVLPEIEKFIKEFEQVRVYQSKLIDMELKKENVLPVFYELTKGTFFPQSKFQDAFDRMKLESDLLGYTSINRYLAYNGLNYILEHDTMAMDLIKRATIDSILASRIENLDLNLAVSNFNQIVKGETDRIEKNAKGKRKILELV